MKNTKHNIYSINICVATTGHDRYDKVAISKFPIVILGDESDLHAGLASDTVKNYIKEHIRTQTVYESAVFYISEIDENYNQNKQEIRVDEIFGSDLVS